MANHPPDWHHAPHHVFVPNTTYMVTAATLHEKHLFQGSERLKLLEKTLFRIMKDCGWKIRAWALFSNHYYWIGQSPEEDSIRRLIQQIHSESTKLLNRLDETPSRKVWFQYWDKCLTYEKRYYARLNYVNNNAVHHGLVSVANQYPFCSAGWMERNFRPAFQKQVASFKYDLLNEPDGFHPAWSKSGTEVPHSEST
jgi:putative transposase